MDDLRQVREIFDAAGPPPRPVLVWMNRQAYDAWKVRNETPAHTIEEQQPGLVLVRIP